MRIGIDLDNTIIDYTEAFLFGARQLKLIPENWEGQKEDLKQFVQSHSEGELNWQRLQGRVYGQWIHHAKLFSGVFRFLWRCRQRGWETIVVSHKTEHGHFDSKKILLRDAARKFLYSCHVFGSHEEDLLDEIKFEPTREQKIQAINDFQCDVFIDDLPEILEHRNFPLSTKRILFDSSNQSKTNRLERVRSWDDLATMLLGDWSELELNNLAESCGFSAVKVIQTVTGGGNSQIFKCHTEVGNEIALKIYPADSKHDRLRSEYDGIKTIRSKCILKVPKPLGVNRDLETTVFRWVDGETVIKPTFEDIDKTVEFLSSLHRCRNQIEFNDFPNASAACFSGQQIEEQIISRLEILSREENDSLNLFLNKEFFDILKKMQKQAKDIWPNKEYDLIINRSKQILSPSDFGFHNALRKRNGSLVFLDFEYFGWDDPVKLMCDFAFHPGMELSESIRKYWFKATLNLYGYEILKRLTASWPLYGLCWVLIMLNEFRSDIWKRRCAANPMMIDSRSELELRQLERSRQLLKLIDNSVQTQTFDFM